MSQPRPNIKSFIRSGQFSKRFNISGRQGTAPEATLSTISSAGSEEDDGYETPIDDYPQEKSKIAGELGQSSPNPPSTESISSPEVREERPSVIQRTLFGSVPSIISNLSSRRSTASRSSRSSTASRGSTASSAGQLPTITEVPVLPEFLFENSSAMENGDAPNTPPQQGLAIPLIPPPPNFQPVNQTQPDAQSLSSTLVQTTPRSDVLITPSTSPPHGSPPPPKYDQSTYAPSPPLPAWPLPSADQYSEKRSSPGTKSAPFSPALSSPRSGNTSSLRQPSSRFSWHLSNVEKCQSWFTRWFVDWWMFEILCWVFSAICMLIIAVVLIHFNKKRVPDWKGLTLNSFISVLSGFGRAALLVPAAEALGQLKWNWFSRKPRQMMDFELLDSASRGPWGSFVLLARTKGITLHSLGAAIILLTLPLDLFFQQIVAYPTVWVQTEYAAPLARTTQYNPPPAVTYFNKTRSIYADQSIFGAEMPYFLRNPVNVPYNPGCPTSNCTWDPFDTLVVSSSCVEAPSVLQLDCQITAGDWLPDIAPLELINPNISACGWFFNPSENFPPQLMTGYWLNGSLPQDAIVTRILPFEDDAVTKKRMITDGSINFKHIQNPISDFLVASLPSGAAGAYKNETPVVHECVLHWAVQTIQASYSIGVYSEIVTNEIALNTNDADNPWPHPNYYLPQFNITLPDHTAPGGQTLFGLNNLTARAVQWANAMFMPSVWVASDATSPLSAKFFWNSDLPLVTQNAPNIWGASQNITALTSSLASSLTNTLRTTVDQETQLLSIVNGTSWKEETHVHLRWDWFALPLALLLFTMVFLITTVYQSRKVDQKVGIWKTSALAVLFNGLGEEIQDTIGPKVRTGDARTRAKRLTVQLDD